MAATRIHHINFVVRDLDAACKDFAERLHTGPFVVVDHAARGARIARTRIGESWLVLVAPYDANSVPGRFLAEHGEGFFMLSIGSDDLDTDFPNAEIRAGILDWQVADIGELNGALLQLTRDENQ
jgi:methylmalonyl-CoA/ethylmalonyl-CoA epimerase